MLKTRKSIGAGKGSGSDDDFKPIKPAALKRKPAEKKAAPQKSNEKEDAKSRAAESSVPKRKPAPKVVDVEDDEDDDMYIAPPPKTKPPARKKAAVPASDSDSDEVIEVPSVPAKARPIVGEKPSKGKGKAKVSSPKRKR